MVGMMCVVLIFPWGQTGAPTRRPRKSFFPELHPINFPCIWDRLDEIRQRPLVWGGETLGVVPNLTSPILRFSSNFYLEAAVMEKPGSRGRI